MYTGSLQGKQVLPTHWDEVAVVLQHHVPVQHPLSWVQVLPLLLSEAHSHIPEWQWSLENHTLAQSPGVRIRWLMWGKKKSLKTNSYHFPVKMLTKDLYYVAYTLVLKCFYTLWLNKRNHGRDTIGKLVNGKVPSWLYMTETVLVFDNSKLNNLVFLASKNLFS